MSAVYKKQVKYFISSMQIIIPSLNSWNCSISLHIQVTSLCVPYQTTQYTESYPFHKLASVNVLVLLTHCRWTMYFNKVQQSSTVDDLK